MAHGITENDIVASTKGAEWHGLGRKIEGNINAKEAQQRYLNWDVAIAESQAKINGVWMPLADEGYSYRVDTGKIFGACAASHQLIQNSELAEFCDLLSTESGGVTIDTVGSLFGGERVWFSIKMSSFATGIAQSDQIDNYICVSNGHKRGIGMRCTPTQTRVVCANTLNMVIGGLFGKKRKISAAEFRCNHTKNIREKVGQAREALGLYQSALSDTQSAITSLNVRKPENREALMSFFAECYARDWGSIPTDTSKKTDANKRGRAVDAMASMYDRFQREESVAGATWWNAFNAYSGWLQHDKPLDIANPVERAEAQKHSNLFGVNASRTIVAFQSALQLAT